MRYKGKTSYTLRGTAKTINLAHIFGMCNGTFPYNTNCVEKYRIEMHRKLGLIAGNTAGQTEIIGGATRTES